MNRREQLIDNYEDALFAVLMDKVAEEEGAKLREENQRLKEDPDAAVPEHVDAVARETIRKAFAGQKRRSALKTIGRVVNKVAVVVLICSVLFVTAYAAFPEVQLRTLNLLIQSSDVASKLTLVTGEEKNNSFEQNTGNTSLCGYSIPDLSENDFSITDQGEDKHGGWIKYESSRGEIVRISITSSKTKYIDTENVEREEVSIKGYSGFLVTKDNRVTLAWSEADHEAYISLVCINLSKDIALHIAEHITHVIS